MRQEKRGFTLIEMLVVISVIAILVAIVVPVISKSSVRAKAAVDAANLRTILGEANIVLTDETVDIAAAAVKMEDFNCASIPGAKSYIYYVVPGFIEAYFESDGQKFTVDSFAEAASTGNPPVAAEIPAGGTAYPVGGNGGN